MREGVKRNFILQQGFEEPAPASLSAAVFGASLPTSNGSRVDRGRNLVSVPASVLSALCCFVVECSAPETQSLRCSVQLTFGAIDRRFLPYPGSGTPSHGASDGGHVCLACGLLLHFGLSTAAYVLEGIFLAAVLALTLGGFCLGSFVFHLLRGKGAFARQTLR